MAPVPAADLQDPRRSRRPGSCPPPQPHHQVVRQHLVEERRRRVGRVGVLHQLQRSPGEDDLGGRSPSAENVGEGTQGGLHQQVGGREVGILPPRGLFRLPLAPQLLERPIPRGTVEQDPAVPPIDVAGRLEDAQALAEPGSVSRRETCRLPCGLRSPAGFAERAERAQMGPEKVEQQLLHDQFLRKGAIRSRARSALRYGRAAAPVRRAAPSPVPGHRRTQCPAARQWGG